MTYFSRSPEEWKKYDEERKKERDKKNKPKKMVAKYTLFIIIALSIVAVFFTLFGPRFSRFIFSHSVTKKGINLNLQTQDDYYYPEAVKIKIYIQNTKNKKDYIKIEDFTFQIVKISDSQVIHHFSSPETVEAQIQPLQTLLLFDLSKESEIKALPDGKYQATASFLYNGERINLTRDFYYNQRLVLNTYPKEMFYLKNEFPVFSIVAVNRTNKTITDELFGRIKINDKKKEVHEQSFFFGPLNLKSLDSIAFELPLNKNFEPGIYNSVFEFESTEENYYAPLIVVEKIEKDTKDLSLIFYTTVFISRGDPLYFEANLKNSKKKPRPLEIEKLGFRLYYENQLIFNYENNDAFRIYISELGTTKVFNLSDVRYITLDRSGNYQVEFSVTIGNNTLSKQQQLSVY
ncbi:MAG TPA: hypothetical protein PK894_00190 [Defluviitoga sp.]|nr:hypothetical protein [Defluviitoga sp.]HOP24290.1 hypothetical protein [Defluviitoga sp.]HPZ28118.1 hypothetical protein [Defluviitoga sp.]HQD62008.1 hypothetical protein [Defluviitoga sp.]